MGCAFNFAILKAKNEGEARKEVEELIETAAWEHGHGGYTGSFAEANGVAVHKNTFSDLSDAEEWLDENAEKWGPAIIAKTKDGKYCVGANCSC